MIMSRIQNLVDIITKPQMFFSDLKAERFANLYLFYIILLTIFIVGSISFTFLAHFVYTNFQIPLLSDFYNPSELIFNLILFAVIYVLGFGTVFLSVGILHLYLKLFGATQSFQKTFQLLVYSYVPFYLFSFIPFIGFLTYFWSWILLFIGVQKTHKLSQTKAIFAIFIIPIVVMMLLGLALFTLVIGGMILIGASGFLI